MTHFNENLIRLIKYKNIRRSLLGKILNNILNVVVCKNHDISLAYLCLLSQISLFQIFEIIENFIDLNLIKTR